MRLTLFLLLLAACAKGGAPAAKPECASNADCSDGLVCAAGSCIACSTSSQCDIVDLCDPVQHSCGFRACWGAECKQHADCSVGDFCVQGLCLNPGVARTSEGETCAVVTCGSDRDCNVGQRCNQRTFVCEQDLGCLANAPCGAGQVCNPAASTCEAGCATSQECGSLLTCEGGRCVQCSKDADCGPGLSCDVAAGVCQGPSGCSTSRDCVSPQVCDDAAKICAAPRGPCTSNETCGSDQRCDTRTGTCIDGACLPDRLAPNGDAAHGFVVTEGTFASLTLCSPEEEDWFAIDLLSGDTVQAVSSVDPLVSFDLSLLDAAGQLLDEKKAAVESAVGSDGRYFIRARTNDASALYSLRVDRAQGTACAHSPLTPHPDAADALAIGAGNNFDFAVCPTEETWFLLRPPAGDGVDVTGSLDPTAGGALDFSLFDSDGITLIADDQTGSAAPHVAGKPTGEQLFLRVRGVPSTASNRYDVTLRYTLP
jgi:hypothetical protein